MESMSDSEEGPTSTERSFGAGKDYYAALRTHQLSRADVLRLMREKLETGRQFSKTTVGQRFLKHRGFEPDTLAYQTMFSGGMADYTEITFVIANNNLYYGTRSSDSIWDNYSYSVDFGKIWNKPIKLPFVKAIFLLFDEQWLTWWT